MSLRRRVLIASGTGLGVIILGFIIAISGFLSVASTQGRITDTLTPAGQMADSLLLAQTGASGDLSDYVLTGADTAIASHQSAISTSEAMLGSLMDTFANEDPAFLALVDAAASAQRAWFSADAQPTLEAMAEGKVPKAGRITNKKKARDSYDSMIAATTALQTEIELQRSTEVDSLSSAARTLGIYMFISGILLILGFIGYFIYFQRWVIFPLMDIRKDIQLATRDPEHKHPIEPIGAPEFLTLAKDAETLRRNLVAEIDEATAARKGLAQDAPLVAAVREEMRVGSATHCQGVAIAGLAASAEGVLAGDYWDYVPIDEHRVALFIADVSGKGAAANVVALRIRAIMRASLARDADLLEAVALAAESTKDDEYFVTALLMIANTQTNTLTWLNAGHPSGIGVTHDKEEFYLNPTGPLISSLGGTWSVSEREFVPGDIVLGVTDGFLDVKEHPNDDTFAEGAALARIVRGLDSPVRQHPDEVVARLVAHIREISPRWRQDDVTVVALSRLEN